MAVTITDVARAAGVSASTVSRAMSAPSKVDPATRARVLAMAEHLGYRPNRAARGLITGRTGTLGLVLPDLSNPFFPGLVKAVQQRARKDDYHVLMTDTDEDPTAEYAAAASFANQVDGLVLCAPRMRPEDLRRTAALAPTVLVNRQAPDLPAVVFDGLAGAAEVVAHLAGLGHRRIGYVGGPRASWSREQLLRGLRAGGARHDVGIDLLGTFAPTFDGGHDAVDAVLVSGSTAVLAYNDLVATGLCQALAARGRSVPQDVSVVGVDDIFVASMTTPPLTTLSLPTDVAGQAAVELLLGLLARGPRALGAGPDDVPPPRVEVPASLVVRASTAPPRGG